MDSRRSGRRGGASATSTVDQETVLVALCGLSPGVISETVWALARESPPVHPSRVVVLTTSAGRDCLRDQLLASGAWTRLCEQVQAPPGTLRLGDSVDSIRLFPAPDRSGDLTDILSAADSVAAGDFILETLRSFTENPGVRVVLSLAGGRKTMGALGALAMALLGRAGDRLCHVLVGSPYDDPRLSPRFAFPDATVTHRLGRTLYAGRNASVVLHDIPFVRTRDVFQAEYGQLPGSFSATVGLANAALAHTPAQAVRIEVEPRTRACRIDGRPLDLSTPEFVLFWLLCRRAADGAGVVCGQAALSEALSQFAATISVTAMPEVLHWDRRSLEDDGYVRRLVSRLRTKLRETVGASAARRVLDPCSQRGHYGLAVPATAISIEET